MTKQELIKQLDALSPEQVDRVLPYLEADLAAVDQLADLKRNIDFGRHSATQSPLQDAPDVYARARKSI